MIRTLRVTHGVERVEDRDASSGRQTRPVHRARQAEAQVAAGTSWLHHGLIFAFEVGTPMDPDNFSHSFVRLCERTGLGHWHPHELRHSRASLMLAEGTPLHVVSDVLGHASIGTTKDVYGHLLEGDKRAARRALAWARGRPGERCRLSHNLGDAG